MSDEAEPLSGGSRSMGDSLDRVIGRLEGLEKTLAELKDDFRMLSARLTEHTRTPWSVLGVWAAVIVAVIGLGGSGYVRDQGRLEATQQQLIASFYEHISDGHPMRVADHAIRNTQAIAELDTNLQREIRDVTGKVQVQVDALEKTLQREMMQLDSLGTQDRANMHELLNDIRTWQQESIKIKSRHMAQLSEHEKRIARLENTIDKLP